ncbi:pentatricopeptide repeat-containing protein At1g11900 isoform X2 [Cajanus cajan]|uniref:pentatricopeptide repeat-containing protein At1g11900 isoform X2 n=1 Tax=Cajanus cajan TaxID=3821 RepID=UPI00098DB1AA|nr:pentatricopeptide repeat-containing protein At1g11900 isoform X2 [Cajanus cajan]XP_020209161.1 pentatricopeptide repeat-containing protein At1g11900 isoform X2 [Cajanus cajan]XP_020209162.1 pentatricopeptide repeat-containing protein At1g11900 isoform X2 [Cajanus cajan]XP_020209163.1 pentatricopeptide repeat-containing protein At1g11900 isoform X2 [Cajanus cajan]XP_029126315.1 pentatricopeptide repeat-containing protein At1g11900 isoform X2 [Cajanus cajan]
MTSVRVEEALKILFHMLRSARGHKTVSKVYSTEVSPGIERVTDEVLKEFLATVENAPAPSVKVYYTYINKMCKAGNLSAASKMLQTLSDKNIFVTPDVYNLILVETSQKNDIDLSCQIFKKLLLSCKSPSATSCLKFAQAFTKVNDCVELLRFLEEISEITTSSFINNIIFAFAKCGQKDKSLVLFEHLKRQSYGLDLVTYNIVLDILGQTGRVYEMLDVFASIEETGFIPDTVSYNTLINGLRKAGRFDMCFAYFKEMTENGIEPDLLTYTAIIENFGRAGNVEESLKCFREMKLKGVLPSTYIYRSLIHNLNKTGKVELATELLEELNSPSTCLAGPADFKQKRRQRSTL